MGDVYGIRLLKNDSRKLHGLASKLRSNFLLLTSGQRALELAKLRHNARDSQNYLFHCSTTLKETRIAIVITSISVSSVHTTILDLSLASMDTKPLAT